MTTEALDAFGNSTVKCRFWSCTERISERKKAVYCSRGCKQADSRKRSRAADKTRARRKKAGMAEGHEDGHLYVIRPGDEPIAKIGYSKSLSERIRVLQTAHWTTLRLVGSLEVKRYFKNDPPDDAIHAELNEEDHVRGEWYQLSPRTLEVLETAGFTLDRAGLALGGD